MANTTFCFIPHPNYLELINFESFVIENFMFGLSDYLKTIVVYGFIFLLYIWATIIVFILSVLFKKMNRVVKFLGPKEDHCKTNGLTLQKKSKWGSMFTFSNKDKSLKPPDLKKELSISNPVLYSIDQSFPGGTKDKNLQSIYEEPSKFLTPTLEKVTNKENLPFCRFASKTNIVMGITASQKTRQVKAPGSSNRVTSGEINPRVSTKPSGDFMNHIKFQTPAPYTRKYPQCLQENDPSFLSTKKSDYVTGERKDPEKDRVHQFTPPIPKQRLSLLKRQPDSCPQIKAIGQDIKVKKPIPRPRTLKRSDKGNIVIPVVNEPCHFTRIGYGSDNNGSLQETQTSLFSITDLVQPSSNLMLRILE